MKSHIPTFLEVAKEVLESGYGVQLHTRGGSMAPLIRGSCMLQVEQVGLEDLHLGDIIVYRIGKTLVAHRLVGRQGEGKGLRLITKGDAIPRRFREEVSPEQVLGLVTAVWGPRGRKIRIDAGWGRILSLVLAASWPFSQGVFLLLAKLKAGLARFIQAPLDPKT